MIHNYYIIVLFMCFALTSCDDKTSTKSSSILVDKEPDYKVVNRFAHDVEAFTQGLEYDGDIIIEGTGQNGTSWISELDPASYTYEKKVSLERKYFGEGVTIFGDRVYQLTYRSKKGFVYNRSDYSLIREFEYNSPMQEGWGLTNDGTSLIASDGTSNLYFIDTIDFKIIKTIPVTNGTSKVPRLNELEYVNGFIYANIWQSPQILKIELSTGSVIRTYDLSDIEQIVKSSSSKVDVLNGVAYNEKKGTFLVTGKYWPYFFELKLED